MSSSGKHASPFPFDTVPPFDSNKDVCCFRIFGGRSLALSLFSCSRVFDSNSRSQYPLKASTLRPSSTCSVLSYVPSGAVSSRSVQSSPVSRQLRQARPFVPLVQFVPPVPRRLRPVCSVNPVQPTSSVPYSVRPVIPSRFRQFRRSSVVLAPAQRNSRRSFLASVESVSSTTQLSLSRDLRPSSPSPV